jgi:hypothetical protein
MKRIWIRMLAVVGVAALALATGAPAAIAQEGDETGQALCEALSSEDLSELLGGRYQAEPGFEYCSWNLASPYNISVGWQTGTLEDSKQYWTPGKDVTVGGRPGWLAADLGALLIGFDNGVIVLTTYIDPTMTEDVEGTFLELGERLVPRAASLDVPPPTPEPFEAAPESHVDPDLEALLPSTVGDQLMIVQSMSGELLMLGGEEAMQPLTDALAAQGLTIADVSLGSANTADFATRIQALRVKGGDAQALEPFMVQLVAQGAAQSRDEIAGKPVTVIASPGGSQYVYTSGEILWLVQAVEPALSEIIAALP